MLLLLLSRDPSFLIMSAFKTRKHSFPGDRAVHNEKKTLSIFGLPFLLGAIYNCTCNEFDECYRNIYLFLVLILLVLSDSLFLFFTLFSSGDRPIDNEQDAAGEPDPLPRAHRRRPAQSEQPGHGQRRHEQGHGSAGGPPQAGYGTWNLVAPGTIGAAEAGDGKWRGTVAWGNGSRRK